MHVNQHLSILFYLKRRKANKAGMIPIYYLPAWRQIKSIRRLRRLKQTLSDILT